MHQRIRQVIRSLRPQQWSKNLLLFAALLFSKNLFSGPHVIQAMAAFIIFCLLTGGIYLINDVLDIENDRRHPVKRNRPIASGSLSRKSATWISVFITVTGLLCGILLNIKFAAICALYVTGMLGYSLFLKKIIILDVIIIAIGFVLRAAAGAVAIGVVVSPWLLICTFFAAIYFVLLKRYHEIVLLGEKAADVRNSLSLYNSQFLHIMIAVATAATMISYSFYTIADRTIHIVGSYGLAATIPFVAFGLFRYLYLVYKNNLGGNPEILVFTDKSMLLNFIAWIFIVVIILFLKF